MHSSYTQLTLSPKGLMLAGNLLAKRTPKGTLAIDGQEATIQALLIAAYGKPVSPRVMNLIKRAGALLAEVQESDWENRTPHQPNQIPTLAKAQMMLALAGLGSMEEENLPQLTKTLRALHKGVSAHELLKAFLHKDDSEEEDDEEDDDEEGDDTSSGSGSSDGGSSTGGGNYNPDEPRDWHGRWTTGGVSNAQTADDSTTDAASTNNTSSDNGTASQSTQPTQPADTSSGSSGNGNSTDNSDGTKSKANNQDNSAGNTAQYADGTPVINPNTGQPYPLPAGMDIAANVAYAHAFAQTDATDAEKALLMTYWFRQGGPEDYQRPDGYIAARVASDFISQYTGITNYGYGAVAAAMGYSLDDTLSAAGLYNQTFGNTNHKPEDMDSNYSILKTSVQNITQGYNDYKNSKWTK